MADYSFFKRDSGGGLILACYHPRSSDTWIWSLSLIRKQKWLKRVYSRTPREWRRNQWHDYLKLPFGYQLCLSRQDYHRQGSA